MNVIKGKLFINKLFSKPFTPQRFFLIIGGTLGLLLVFLMPPFQAPDEHTHFYKEVYLANGGLVAHKQTYRVGADLPAKYSQTADRYKYMFLDSEKKLDLGILKKDLVHPNNNNQSKATAFENTAQYPPLAYAPQSVAIFIINLLKGPVLFQLYGARLVALLTWLLLMFFAIKKIPFAKWGLVALALTPLSIFLSASSSNDAITFGISALFIAQVVSLISGKGLVTKDEKRNLLLNGLALGLCKPPYLILVLLAIAIPIKRLQNTKQFIKFIALLLVVTFFSAILWELVVHKILLNFYPGSNSTEQVRFLINHPISSFLMIIKTLTIYPIGDDLVLQLVGLKAWMVAQTPFWLIMANYTLIIVAILFKDQANKIKNVELKIFPRLLSIFIGLVGALTISLLLYITYTPVGLDTIVGLQGRYFVPFSYLLIPALGASTNFYIVGSSKSLKIIKIALILVAFTVIPLTISRYYPL